VPGVTNLPLLETVSVHVAPVKPSGQTQIHWKFTNPPFWQAGGLVQWSEKKERK
jgi:hypothetical protein